MKIDINAHLLPPKFMDTLNRRARNLKNAEIPRYVPVNIDICNIVKRFEIMDKFTDLLQVITPTGQPLEYTHPGEADYLAKIYNDEMAELVLKYPDRFVAAVACLPLNNIDAALKEIDRAINELGFKGILLNTPVNGRPLDSPVLMPIYECMSNYDLPIWIHPARPPSTPDYAGEEESKYNLFLAFGWPYETSIAMSRLVCSGILAKYPNLKFITHHAGGMIPFFATRIRALTCSFDAVKTEEFFRMFYNDTALSGNTPALMCARAFFGTEHLLFGTDMPYGPGLGEQFIRNAIDAIEGMNISESDKERIFQGNAKALLRLDL